MAWPIGSAAEPVADERVGRAVALLIVGLFLAAQVISYLDRARPVPAEIYPLTTLAVGYLLGHRFLRGNDK